MSSEPGLLDPRVSAFRRSAVLGRVGSSSRSVRSAFASSKSGRLSTTCCVIFLLLLNELIGTFMFLNLNGIGAVLNLILPKNLSALLLSL